MVNFKELSVGDKVETIKGFKGVVTNICEIPFRVVSVDYNTCSGIHHENYYKLNNGRYKWNIVKVFKKTKINEIVLELLSHGILVEVILKDGDIAYSFFGFAKINAQYILFEKDNKLYLETHYAQIGEIDDTVDVVKVAFHWDKKYSHSVNYPNTNFLTEDNNWWSLYKKYNLI